MSRDPSARLDRAAALRAELGPYEMRRMNLSGVERLEIARSNTLWLGMVIDADEAGSVTVRSAGAWPLADLARVVGSLARAIAEGGEG